MRLFVAVNFAPEIRAGLAAYSRALQAASEQARPTREQNFHLTLAFLGEQPDESAASAALQRLAGAPFKLYSGRLGRFQRGAEDIYWLGLKDSPELTALQQALVRELQAVGFALDNRPFTPHLTLARAVHGCREDTLPQTPRFIQRVQSIELMESLRLAGQLVYRPLDSRSLGE